MKKECGLSGCSDEMWPVRAAVACGAVSEECFLVGGVYSVFRFVIIFFRFINTTFRFARYILFMRKSAKPHMAWPAAQDSHSFGFKEIRINME